MKSCKTCARFTDTKCTHADFCGLFEWYIPKTHKSPADLAQPEASAERISSVVRSNATTGWISVKDRLPEDAMLYLCFGEIWYNKNIQRQFIRVVEYKNCKFRCDFNPCAYVTHWMLLPEPPEV